MEQVGGSVHHDQNAATRNNVSCWAFVIGILIIGDWGQGNVAEYDYASNQPK